MTAAIAPIIIAIASFVLRLFNLGSPKGFIFDELYYVDGAQDFLNFGVEVTGVNPEFIAHPPLGKWLIAAGIAIFGDNEFGWRFATAVFGTLLILLIARLVHVLFYSPVLTALAAGLMAVDGLLLVHSRTALLDLFLTFFTLLGIYLWSRNRHWWAGFAFGLALGCKWSAIYFIAIIVLITLYRILVTHDIRETPRKIALVVTRYGLLPLTVYTLTWLGWFFSDRGWDRQSSSNPIIALINYHKEILSFHVGLTEKHPYQSHPLGWLVMLRPTSFFYDAPSGCGNAECAREVLAIGTPFLWWIGTIAIFFVVYRWVKSLRNRTTDNAANFVVIGLVAGYLPWFALPDRTMFAFYAIVIQPFLVVAIVYCAKLVLESRLNPLLSQGIVIGVFILIFICFLYFLPLFTGQLITYEQWQNRMWFSSWI